MSARPWEPDRPLTLEDARAIIKACFPTIDSTELTHIGSGWDFDAFLTADGWVFRFPRRADCADSLEVERRVHHLVSSVLPPRIAVPRTDLVGQPALGFPYRFAGHRFIPGVGADTADADGMPALAREIGAALGAIHAIPEDAARAAGVGEMDMDDVRLQEWVTQRLEVAPALRGLHPVVDHAVSWVSKQSLPHTRFKGPLRFIHNDLSPEHFIVDPTTGQLTGIIDWSDAMLGDSARDFVFLVTWRGGEFAEEVLRGYPHSVDHGFRERLDFMASFLSVMWLAEAYERDIGVAKHVEWVRNAFASALTSP